MASRELNMEVEADRLSTFDTWPNPHVQPRDLAASGFFYTRVGDSVKCFRCGVEIDGWQEGADPFLEHESARSNCLFIQNYLLESFPLPENLAHFHNVPHSCPFHLKIHKQIVLKSMFKEMKMIQRSLELLKIYEIEPPHQMKFSTYESRLLTFKTWPKGMKIKIEKLCDAGFYYSGHDDTTVCFHCGKDVSDWTRNNDPWVEHALFSPKCSYVLLNKGIEFVENIFKGRGCPKPKKKLNYMKNLLLPDDLKGVIEIRHYADPSTSRSANESEENKDPTNQESCGSEEPVRSANESTTTENSSVEDMASSQPWELNGAVGKELTGSKGSLSKGCKPKTSKGFLGKGSKASKGYFVKDSKAKASKGYMGKVSKAQASKGSLGKGGRAQASGFLCQHECLDGSKKVDEKYDDTATLKSSDTKERIDDITHDLLCRICCQEPLGIAILPCGHLIACAKCASSLKKCPVCFEDCIATVRIYLS